MSYNPPTAKTSVQKAEKRFLTFFVVATLLFIALIVLIVINKPINFWIQNKLWSIGSYLVGFSIVQIRFFNIKTNASPDNRRFNSSDFNKKTTLLEKGVKLFWIVGFGFIVVSRWIIM